MSTHDTTIPAGNDATLAALLANASSTGIRVSGPTEIALWGTFGGGTYVVQLSRDGGNTWIDVAGGSFTAAGALIFDFGYMALIRLTGSGGAGNTVNASATKVRG